MHKRPILNDGKIVWLFALLICLSTLESVVEGARYIKYIVGPLSILLWASRGLKTPKQKSATTLCLTIYLAWLAFSLLWSKTILGPKDIFFIASYSLPLLLFNTDRIKIEPLFWLYTAFLAISAANATIGNFSISESTSLFEGASSFVYGAFFIFFLIRKKYILAAISLIIMLATLKRIALIGVILCLALWYLPDRLRALVTSAKSILIFNSLALLLIFSITNGYFNDLIQSFSDKGTAEFTLGRVYHYIGIVSDIAQNPQRIIFGNGAGSAYEKAIFDHTSETPNLHSDTLKIFYEGGIISFFLLFYFIGKSNSIAHRILIIYLSTLFITDNVLIYSGTMFFILTLALKLEATTQQATRKILEQVP